MLTLIECVPNISEGRRSDVVNRCADTVPAAGAALLDVSMDAAHHRSVLTFAGPPDRVAAAAVALVGEAIAQIDLRLHQGVHPRLGAVDVMPFVPLAGAEMADAVSLARDVGRIVAARFDLPVYLYEAAAAAPERRPLEAVRRGQFEGLGQKLRQPGWEPDFGPSVPHPSAGAIAIGARMPLIAFNVNLATDRLDVARSIATAVRARSGGLPFVKALGLALEDRGVVQVSMNLTDYRVTSPLTAFEAVCREAASRTVDVIESEIVGLVPAAALPPDPVRCLRLPHFTRRSVLEERLRDAGLLD